MNDPVFVLKLVVRLLFFCNLLVNLVLLINIQLFYVNQ